MDIETGLRDDQGYSARGVVAKVQHIGDLQSDILITPIYKYLTLDCGKGNRPQCVEFVKPAPRVIDETNGESYLDLAALEFGEFVVSPGLVYKKIEFTSALYTEHLKALQTYRPKDILIADKSEAKEEFIDGGHIDMTTDAETKSAVQDHLKKTIH